MNAATDVMLAYRGASVGYGEAVVVADADLEVRAGEVVGLVGPNGAGKSTLLRAVTGDADLRSGVVEVAGRSRSELSPRERASLVGVVPQQVSAAFSLPGREFVEMGRHPHLPRFGGPSETDRAAVRQALELTGTTNLASRPVDALSGGDLQRLALAQALAVEPRVLLLDEATAHLDLNHRLQVLDLVRDLADAGMAVLAVFHDLELAARYSDRIAIVAGGRLAGAGTPERVITAEALKEVFGVRAVVGPDAVTGSISVTPVLRDGAVARGRHGTVLVVGGGGTAAPLMRKLVLGGFTVLGAALNAGDADAVLAEALGLEYARIEPFAPMNAEAAVTVARFAERADVIVVGPVPFGRGNIDNLLVAVRARRPLVLVGAVDGRDFTGGAAESYWAEALEHGAVTVEDLAGAERAVFELAGGSDAEQ